MLRSERISEMQSQNFQRQEARGDKYCHRESISVQGVTSNPIFVSGQHLIRSTQVTCQSDYALSARYYTPSIGGLPCFLYGSWFKLHRLMRRASWRTY